MRLSKPLTLFLCVALLVMLPGTAAAFSSGERTGVTENNYSGLWLTPDYSFMMVFKHLEAGHFNWEIDVTQASPGLALTVMILHVVDGQIFPTELHRETIKQGQNQGFVENVDAGEIALMVIPVADEESEVGPTRDSSVTFDLSVSGELEPNDAYPPPLTVIRPEQMEDIFATESIAIEIQSEPSAQVIFNSNVLSPDVADADGRVQKEVALSSALLNRMVVTVGNDSGHYTYATVYVLNHWVMEDPSESVYLNTLPKLTVQVPDLTLVDLENSTMQVDGQSIVLKADPAQQCVYGIPNEPLELGHHEVIVRLYSPNDIPSRTDKMLDIIGWDFDMPSMREAHLWIGKTECIVNKQEFSLDAVPFRDQVTGTTMLPLRFMGDLLGAEVTWRGSDQTVIFTIGDKIVQLNIGRTTALVNGEPVKLAVAPANIGGRTMVPLRFVSENLGAGVFWHPDEGEIVIQVQLW